MSLEQENERLRGLLFIARIGLQQASLTLQYMGDDGDARAAKTAYLRSDPDATEGDATP